MKKKALLSLLLVCTTVAMAKVRLVTSLTLVGQTTEEECILEDGQDVAEYKIGNAVLRTHIVPSTADVLFDVLVQEKGQSEQAHFKFSTSWGKQAELEIAEDNLAVFKFGLTAFQED